MNRLSIAAAVASLLAVVACSDATPAEAVSATEADTQDLTSAGLAPFVCEPEVHKDTTPDGSHMMVAARAAKHDGYDRFVLEFDRTSTVPSYHVELATTSFESATVPGNVALRISLYPARMWNYTTETSTFHGPTTFRPADTKQMTEATLAYTFEGDTTWLVGLDHAACFRVFELGDPPRLVVDVQNDGPTSHACN